MIAMTPSSSSLYRPHYHHHHHHHPHMAPPPVMSPTVRASSSSLTPTSSNDEIDAVAALISLPSVGGAPSAAPQTNTHNAHHAYARKPEQGGHRSSSQLSSSTMADYPRQQQQPQQDYYQPPQPPPTMGAYAWNQQEPTVYGPMEHHHHHRGGYPYRTFPTNQQPEPPFYMTRDGHGERVPAYRESTTTYNNNPSRSYSLPQQQQQQQYFPTTPLVSSTPRPPPPQQSRVAPSAPTNNVPPSCFFGCTSLYLPDDDDVLSPLHCFMRKHCVEAFAATVDDGMMTGNAPAGRGKIVPGQVGIQCVHCKHLEVRPERAVCFPSSLRNIYHSMETWQRRHAVVCKYIPDWIRRELERLTEQSKSSAGGRRQYWEDAALKVGMTNCPTEGIVRFVRRPGPIHSHMQQNGQMQQHHHPSPPRPQHVLVTAEDEPLVTPYLYLLMAQMQSCYFTEADRSGGRSKVKDLAVGYPGMQCRHCNGKSGLGRYFPLSSQALALANSDRNMYNHLIKCRKCPTHVQEDLQRLRKRGSNSNAPGEAKNKRGSRKMFFERVWGRIHRHGSTNNNHPLPALTERADTTPSPRFVAQENEMDIGNTCSI
uniref:Uncharacterized protein n=1 Tax=Grammatophora oceanica TaxID=210454 RepID=A0A7S1UP26_9STRA|mmetsp:Transcript_15246/g.22368  ORF Transcript_15246/g.22368 Transcript_15246/m.22368 type:complete len:594 (+) Transcript_15246:79-1860(+)|eukprot:CAMPEP_0194055200 /NCGR_PEP_ID=MMETSP0009_2-20130614/55907_1 /TAXON_ID=210454 /ORGANISM="Grammatophora oceanica, Strain CCMP 410" /LENGTH=593 /DNA_ID=CAMNT_0038704019 /DNA_START=74 /DNA_END=1855 /DNA_ORIENTATION=+